VSICEHHLLPFSGVAHIAYVPNERLAGLGRLAKVLEIIASRPQLQERLTTEVADALVSGLDPKGVLVVIEARHQCVASRGARQPEVNTVTIASRGVFIDPVYRQEAMALINR
jgi:GTP cyclohydrolase I